MVALDARDRLLCWVEERLGDDTILNVFSKLSTLRTIGAYKMGQSYIVAANGNLFPLRDVLFKSARNLPDTFNLITIPLAYKIKFIADQPINSLEES